MWKRTFDLILSVVGLTLCLPAMAIIALTIRFESPGPILFSQERLGRKGRVFKIYKFRKFPADLQHEGPGVTAAGDPRMTTFGAFLERTKLDELPQLWNILRGDMSFVGPRPESVRYADLFKGRFARILDTVPGVFGPNQTAFRNEASLYPPDQDPEDFYRAEIFPRKAETDLHYFSSPNAPAHIGWIVSGLWAAVSGAVHWNRFVGLHGLIVSTDLLAVALAWLSAVFLRFGTEFSDAWSLFLTGLWLLPTCLLVAMILFGCYRSPVRYFSLDDLKRLARVVPLAWSIGLLGLIGLFHRNSPISLVPLGAILALLYLILPRFLYREWWRRSVRENHTSRKTRLLLYGAGRWADPILSLLAEVYPDTKVVGIVDDAQELRGRYISGERIVGCERDLSTLHALHSFDELWLLFIPGTAKYGRLGAWCKANDVVLHVLPAMPPFVHLLPKRPSALPQEKEVLESRK